jgi:branched-chain amino acid transport system ATP-binding protein
VIRLENVRTGYGKSEALHGVNLRVEAGRTTCLLGPNGAGKTTISRLIGGILPCWSGQLYLDEEDVTSTGAVGMVKKGVGQVLEERHLFGRLSVADNLLLGAFTCYRSLGSAGRAERLKTVYDLFPHLYPRRSQLAGTLSGGEQQMVAIGRALMIQPRVLILDEPGFGLAPVMAETIYGAVARLNEEGMTIVVADEEPVRALALPFSYAYVIVGGQVAVEGASGTELRPEAIASAYLGLTEATDEES